MGKILYVGLDSAWWQLLQRELGPRHVERVPIDAVDTIGVADLVLLDTAQPWAYGDDDVLEVARLLAQKGLRVIAITSCPNDRLREIYDQELGSRVGFMVRPLSGKIAGAVRDSLAA